MQARGALASLQPARAAVRYLIDSSDTVRSQSAETSSQSADIAALNNAQLSVLSIFDIPGTMVVCVRQKQHSSALALAAQALRAIRGQIGRSSKVDRLLATLTTDVLCSLELMSHEIQDQMCRPATLQAVLSNVNSQREVLRLALALAALHPQMALWFDRTDQCVLEKMFLAGCTAQLQAHTGKGNLNASAALRLSGDATCAVALETSTRFPIVFSGGSSSSSSSSADAGASASLRLWLRSSLNLWLDMQSTASTTHLAPADMMTRLQSALTSSESVGQIGLSVSGTVCQGASTLVLANWLLAVSTAASDCTQGIRQAIAQRHLTQLLSFQSTNGSNCSQSPLVAQLVERLVAASWKAGPGTTSGNLLMYMKLVVSQLLQQVESVIKSAISSSVSIDLRRALVGAAGHVTQGHNEWLQKVT